jgi:hypothetical protein
MIRLVEAYIPENAPIKVRGFACKYQAMKEGVYTSVDFEVAKEISVDGEMKKIEGAEAVEFTFVLLDLFDNFLSSIQGIAGPGKYLSGPKKKHKARWLLALDGAFSQYHALCFPSQVRLLDGRIWRCDRDECITWLNGQLEGTSVSLSEEDVFPAEVACEGTSE